MDIELKAQTKTIDFGTYFFVGRKGSFREIKKTKQFAGIIR